MKKVSGYVIITFLLFISFSHDVWADYSGYINGTNVRYRSAIGTILGEFNQYDKITIINTNAGTIASGCNASWYEVNYGGNTVYTCGEFVTITSSNTNQTISDNIYDKSSYNAPSGDGTISCYEDTTDIYLRLSPTGSFTNTKVSCGDVVRINSTTENNGSCNYYYNVTTSSGSSGYICGIYVNTYKLSTTASNYYNNNGGVEVYYNVLRNKGFPESYLSYLAEIHARHPNWNFEAEKINLDFNDVVLAEAYDSRSLLSGSAFDSNYFSTKYGHYDVLNNKFTEDSVDKGWYNASTEAIAYYLDPRTYLNDRYIFAFEAMDYKDDQTSSVVLPILKNTAYSGNTNFSNELVLASKEAGISAVHIASRISQEMGGVALGDPRLGGTFTYGGSTKSGYYNFFNIKSSCTNCSNIYAAYAYEKGWNTTLLGLKGGATFLANNYVMVNQDTIYYEKFDVSTIDGHYTHQFMQNLSVATSETSKKYTSYYNNMNSYLSGSITFTIPVYNNMPAYHVTSPKIGNPNNYLKNITVGGSTISGFSYDKYSYKINISSGTSSINIGATPVVSSTTVKGIGNINITSNNMNVDITVTSANGRSRVYTINIVRDDSTAPAINTILNSSGVKYNSTYMYGISKSSNVSSLINNVLNISSYATINVYDKDGNIKNNGIFKTGDKVKIGNGQTSQTFTTVIYGDVNGDGKIDKLDYLAVLRHYYGYTSYSGVYKVAADVNRDGKIDKLDYLAVLRDYYGYANINQG